MLFRKILHPTDFSDLSQAALHYAADMAHDHGGRLLILHAVETLGPENVTYGDVSRLQPAAYRQRLWDDLHKVKPPRSDIEVEYLLSEQAPAAAIVQVAAEKAIDLIVMASHGRTGLRRLLMGSVAEKVLRAAHCPVLVVKTPAAALKAAPVHETGLHPQILEEKKD